jgi:hypothetical protein
MVKFKCHFWTVVSELSADNIRPPVRLAKRAPCFCTILFIHPKLSSLEVLRSTCAACPFATDATRCVFDVVLLC